LIKNPKKSISEAILDYAKEENAHLIILMTKDEMSKINFFIGRTALEIIENSEIPVLSVVPSSPEESVFNDFIDPFKVFEGKQD
jgi:vacuolar-type H+-ATPase subunit F/Vma7